jgi:hypothetical protein
LTAARLCIEGEGERRRPGDHVLIGARPAVDVEAVRVRQMLALLDYLRSSGLPAVLILSHSLLFLGENMVALGK